MGASSDSGERIIFGIKPSYFWTVFAGMSAFVLVNLYMWREVEPYYPEWGPQVFMFLWLVFGAYSLKMAAYTGDSPTAMLKTFLPYLIVMIPFFTGLLNGSTKGLFPLNAVAVGTPYGDTPPVPMFGFEEYCIYAGLMCLLAVRLIPYKDRIHTK